MKFLSQRVFTVILIIGGLALGIAYANGAFLSSEEKGPRFGRQPQTETGTSSSTGAADLQTPLSDSTAKQLRSLGFQLVKPTPPVSFQRPNLSRENQSIKQFRGRVVVLNFWATWCPPCQKEMPSMQRLWTNSGGDDLVVLAMNMGEGTATVKSFVENFGLTFPVWIDDGAVANQLQVSTLPTTWIISPNGKLLARLRGPIQWDRSSVTKTLESVITDTTKARSGRRTAKSSDQSRGKGDN